MTNRETTLALMRVAGYHDDMRTWMRLYVETRISKPAADAAWQSGRAAMRSGMRCACHDCQMLRGERDFWRLQLKRAAKE